MMKKVILLTAISTVIFSMTVAAYAQRGPGRGKGMRGPVEGHQGRMGEHVVPGRFFGDPDSLKGPLGLTDAQVKQIGIINESYYGKFRGFHDKLSPLHVRLQKMLLEKKVDLAEVRNILKQISEIDVEIKLLKIKHHLDIENTLTPGQREKLRREKREMRKHCPYPEK